MAAATEKISSFLEIRTSDDGREEKLMRRLKYPEVGKNRSHKQACWLSLLHIDAESRSYRHCGHCGHCRPRATVRMMLSWGGNTQLKRHKATPQTTCRAGSWGETDRGKKKKGSVQDTLGKFSGSSYRSIRVNKAFATGGTTATRSDHLRPRSHGICLWLAIDQM